MNRIDLLNQFRCSISNNEDLTNEDLTQALSLVDQTRTSLTSAIARRSMPKRKEKDDLASDSVKRQRVDCTIVSGTQILNRDIVTLIASYEDFSMELLPDARSLIPEQRVQVLFNYLNGSYRPSDLKEALQIQAEDLRSFPNVHALRWHISAEFSQDSHYFNYYQNEERIHDPMRIGTICTFADRILNRITKQKVAVNVIEVCNTLGTFVRLNIQKLQHNDAQRLQINLTHESFSDVGISPLEFILNHIRGSPICLHIDNTNWFLTLNPYLHPSHAWICDGDIESNDLSERIIRTLIACQVKLSQETLHSALFTALSEDRVNLNYARFLLEQGATIEGVDEIAEGIGTFLNRNTPSQTHDLLVSFLLEHPLSKYTFSNLIRGVHRPISKATTDMICSYAHRYKKQFVENVDYFLFDLCDPMETFVEEIPRDQIIFIKNLIEHWLIASPQAKEKLPLLYFMSLLKTSSPLTFVLEDVYHFRITEISETMIMALLQFFKKLHFSHGYADDYKIKVVDTIVGLLLYNLQNKGFKISREELVAQLMSKIDDLLNQCNEVEKKIDKIKNTRTVLIHWVDSLRKINQT